MYQLQPWMAQFGQMGGMQPNMVQPSMASPLAAGAQGATAGTAQAIPAGMGGPMQAHVAMQPQGAMGGGARPMGGVPQVQGPQSVGQALGQFTGAPGHGGLTQLLANLKGMGIGAQPTGVQAAYPGAAFNPNASLTTTPGNMGTPGRANPGAAFNPQALQQYWNTQNAQQPAATPLSWQQYNAQ